MSVRGGTRGLRGLPGVARRIPAVIGLALLPAAVQTPAVAAEANAVARVSDSGSYRYWAFWEQSGKSGDGSEWSYATQGPSVLRPGDGAVIGFRFTVGENSGDAGKPRARADFADICRDTEAKQGSKRIALSIDSGTRAHAPRGETPPEPRTACARVDDDATAADALAEVAEPLRYNSDALLCAIDGYPKRGCGEQVSDAGKDGTDGKKEDGGGDSGEKGEETDEDGYGAGFGSATGVAAGLAAVAVLSFAAARRSRRRR